MGASFIIRGKGLVSILFVIIPIARGAACEHGGLHEEARLERYMGDIGIREYRGLGV